MIHTHDYFRPSTMALDPSEQTKEKILYECEKEYKSCVWTLPDDFDTYAKFEIALYRLEMTSSPGWPYQREATTNGEWLKWNGITMDAMQKARLWHDVKLVMAGKWEHIIRVFIKQEPTKKAKADAGRWRLIMATSLCVQVLWHMVFSELNDLENSKAYEIPSQHGMTLMAGGWKVFLASWQAMGLSCGMDKSSWDWTAPYWALKLDLELRLRLGRGDKMQEWALLARLLYRGMFEDPVLLLSDGRSFKQVIPGVMKSGCVNTISTNSHCQVFLHLAVCIDTGTDLRPFPRACGDDTIHHVKHTYQMDVYRRYGIQVKSISDTIEFMGHEFTNQGVRPLYMQKHLKKLRYMKDSELSQYIDSMARMYVHTEHFHFWEKLARVCACPLAHSRNAYAYWYNHVD